MSSGSAFNPGAWKKAAAGVVVAVGVAAAGAGWWNPGGTFGPPSAPVVSEVAHVFLATTCSDSCTRNVATVPYTAAVSAGNVCLTFNKANTIAVQGDTVLVEAGAFQTQTINADATKTSAAGRCYLGTYVTGDITGG